MRSPGEQAAGETREDPDETVADQPWGELRQSELNDAKIGRNQLLRKLKGVIRPDLFGDFGDDASAEAPIAPVEDR